jgi:serine/threonine protein phosphatase 1
MGNHEEMMLNFLDDPQRHGPRWLRYGGLQTLASFGVAGLSDTSIGPTLDTACATLKAAMGPDLIRWMRHLPTSWQSGNIAVVHAGADPVVPIDDQTQKTLLWGHPDFGKTARTDETWVLHGHTIVDAPEAANGLISIDTGAFATGRLTIASVSAEGVSFAMA